VKKVYNGIDYRASHLKFVTLSGLTQLVGTLKLANCAVCLIESPKLKSLDAVGD
jgi:hypothetical protein